MKKCRNLQFFLIDTKKDELGISREKNIDRYITGSNSKMLSSDIVTEFRDKATNINLAPLSFEEYYNYSGL